MEPGYEEFEKSMLAKDPGADTNMIMLFRFYFMLGFLVANFSKLESTLGKTLTTICGLDYKFEDEIVGNLTFRAKIDALANVCELNTIRVKDNVFGIDHSQVLKNSKLETYLRRCVVLRNQIVHGVWNNMTTPNDGGPDYFSIIYNGKWLHFTMSKLLEIEAISRGTEAKLRSTFNIHY